MAIQFRRPSTAAKPAVVNQTFSFDAPGATRVVLVGDFTHWQKNPVCLRKHADGIWRTTVPLAPGEHRYRYVVDGDWCGDPACPMRVSNPYGTEDEIVRISSEAQP